MQKADNFFSPAEKERISQAIAAVEKLTAGEVAVVVADESDRYPEAAILSGITLGGVIALLITDLLFHDSLWFFLPIALLAGFAIGWCTGKVPTLKRFFVPQARLEEEVAQRALQAFYDKGLHRTRDATGVLFFISLLEHKAWVLAYQGIYQKISQEKLNQYAANVAAGIKEGRAAEVLCQEIQQIGITLAQHFPIKPDDINELSNEVRRA